MSGGSEARTLLVVPAMRALVRGPQIGLTQKFVTGVSAFQRHWPGHVRLLMHPTTAETDNLDNLMFHRDELPCDLIVEPLESAAAIEVLRSASVVLLSLEFRQTSLSSVCKRFGLPCAYTTENTLRTRVQIASAEEKNPLRLARRIVWELAEEQRNLRAVSRADGIQCNGTPTFDAYSKRSPWPLLFFDTRTSTSQLASETDLTERFRVRTDSGVLRLGFSGRLVSIKGVLDLVRVARVLADGGHKFMLTICGSGELEGLMRSSVQNQGLQSIVRFMGNLEFESELLPFMRREVDLFVCCHSQGDPSCTYLETMACGVPIAGYGNEAWQGLSERSGCGWVTQMRDPERLASKIASLTEAEIERQSAKSLQFAQAHTFDIEFQRRIKHLESLAASTRLVAR